MYWNWVDGAAPQATRQTQTYKNPHLAKKRVAGSNPVFRSILPGGRQLLNLPVGPSLSCALPCRSPFQADSQRCTRVHMPPRYA